MFSDKWKKGYKSQINRRLAADFTGWETGYRKFEEQFDRVVKALRADEGRRDGRLLELIRGYLKQDVVSVNVGCRSVERRKAQ